MRYIEDNKITNEFVERYTKTTYRIVGEHRHSAIKPCHWLEQKLMTGRENRNCYKGVFGVQSHRCLQNTPSMPFCNHQCVFCWRDLEFGSLGSKFIVEPDEPESLIDEMLRHHRDIIKNHLHLRRFLDNYEIMIDILTFMVKEKGVHSLNSLSKNLHISKTKIERAINLLKNQKFVNATDFSLKNFKVDSDISDCIKTRDEVEKLINLELTTPDEIIQAHTEALNPNHAAISLDGEPLLYPKLSGLIEGFRNRNMTTFVVTNGTTPEILNSLEALPSQLYVTLPAPNEQLYKKVCRPMVKNGWKKIMQTLELLESLNCRTVIRLTAVKNLNISEKYVRSYVKIVEKANPNFFEIKGFTLQAKALLISDRLKANKPIQYFFPEFSELSEFSNSIEDSSNFKIIYTNEPSRDFLFAVNWNPKKDPKITMP